MWIFPVYKEPPYVSMVVMQNRRLPTEAHFYFPDIAIIVLAVSFVSLLHSEILQVVLFHYYLFIDARIFLYYFLT
jgi:hypothetical protein